MLDYKIRLIAFILCCLVFSYCKKHETIPELGMGNDFNPSSGVEFVKLDSSRLYTTTSKYLRVYVSIKSSLIASNGFTASKINVYKNGVSGTVLGPNPPYTFLLSNVISGQVYKFEFTLLDSQGRESKKSSPYTIAIP